MDAAAVHALENLYRTCKIHKTKLKLTEVKEQPYRVLENISKLVDEEIVNPS